MANRYKMSRKKSRRNFSKYASRHHYKNDMRARPQRGGIRL